MRQQSGARVPAVTLARPDPDAYTDPSRPHPKEAVVLSEFGPSTWLAVFLGAALAVVAFVPVAAHRYRAAGRLRLLDLIVLLLVAMYSMALWTYTLVPIPENDDFRCVGANFTPFAFVADIAADGRSPLANRAFLQAAFNIVLFLPLGFFLRTLTRRGVVTATLIGLAVSLAIEFTQRTGIWGLYHCAYRTFDVDDLILNTAGALAGSLLALPTLHLLQRRRPAPPVTQVSLGRRWTGMLVDLLVITGVGVSLTIGWRVIALGVLQWQFDELPGWVDQLLLTGVPLLVEAWWVLGRGQTVGEDVVRLEPVAADGARTRSRWIKLAAGVGGYLVLTSDLIGTALPGQLLALATVVFAIRSRNHRGLSHIAAGMELRIERPDDAAQNG